MCYKQNFGIFINEKWQRIDFMKKQKMWKFDLKGPFVMTPVICC